MVGIRSFGGDVPRYRLSRGERARAWGARALGGERSGRGHAVGGGTVATEGAVGEPTTAVEQVIGDSGAALVVSDEGVIAELERVASISEEFTDVWRQDGDICPRVGDPKFIQTYGYGKMLREALQAAASAVGIENVTKVVFGSSSPRDHAAMAKALGLKPEQVQPPPLTQAG